MNSIIKFFIYYLILLSFNIKVYSIINHGKNINISYDTEQSFKNEFYENFHKQEYIRNKIIKYKILEKSETFVPYKTKLDNIVKYIF